MEVFAVVLSCVSVTIAVLTYFRQVSGNIPTAELLCRDDGDEEFYLLIQNPSRRTIILETVQAVTDGEFAFNAYPHGINLHGSIHRSFHQHIDSGSPNNVASVFAAIPPGAHREIRMTLSDRPKGLDLYLRWSRSAPLLERILYPWHKRYAPEYIETLALAAKGDSQE